MNLKGLHVYRWRFGLIILVSYWARESRGFATYKNPCWWPNTTNVVHMSTSMFVNTTDNNMIKTTHGFRKSVCGTRNYYLQCAQISLPWKWHRCSCLANHGTNAANHTRKTRCQGMAVDLTKSLDEEKSIYNSVDIFAPPPIHSSHVSVELCQESVEAQTQAGHLALRQCRCYSFSPFRTHTWGKSSVVHRARCSWAVGLGKDLANKNSSQTSKESLDVVCCQKPRNRCCPDLAQSIDSWPMPSPLQRHLHPQEDLGGRAQRFGMSDKLFEAKPSPLFQQLHQIAHSTIEKIPCNPNPVEMLRAGTNWKWARLHTHFNKN